MTWIREHISEIIVLIGGFVVMNLIFIAEVFRASDTVDPEGASQLGNFVGGYVGTLFALASFMLLLRNLKNQQKSSEILMFETKYFELLRLHRDNVAELEVEGISGRKLFVVLIREFRLILEIVIEIARECSQNLNKKELLHITYYCLYYGTGPNSSRILKLSLAEFDSKFIGRLEDELNDQEKKKMVKCEKNFPYIPFEGHQSRLGHYYRHLYQAVKYVDQQEILTFDKKYEFVKTIRAQLSNHEQALLLLNSISPMGNRWWSDDYMRKYEIVKNIPPEFFDCKKEIDMSDYFEPGYFEWEDVKSGT
ncbi:putative phage abortive infection protein [Nitrosomonas sp. sh817]|uniref:putative phage abortive infection protein n=1 Tax=Nitrosomonas sp. sh817 TaxID=3070658 RepID=UPI0027DD2375|nr:putative phage abortive infection protein [Nitrosomonas sp. sh817]WMJ08339.1 putative phage abortive infection protein [Nitrosomonas sp. sh817]